MNARQKKIMWVAVAVMVLMLVFPPFSSRSGYEGRYKSFRGYGFIVQPRGGTVEMPILLVQWVAVAIVAVAAYLTVGKQAKPTAEKESKEAGKAPRPLTAAERETYAAKLEARLRKPRRRMNSRQSKITWISLLLVSLSLVFPWFEVSPQVDPMKELRELGKLFPETLTWEEMTGQIPTTPPDPVMADLERRAAVLRADAVLERPRRSWRDDPIISAPPVRPAKRVYTLEDVYGPGVQTPPAPPVDPMEDLRRRAAALRTKRSYTPQEFYGLKVPAPPPGFVPELPRGEAKAQSRDVWDQGQSLLNAEQELKQKQTIWEQKAKKLLREQEEARRKVYYPAPFFRPPIDARVAVWPTAIQIALILAVAGICFRAAIAKAE